MKATVLEPTADNLRIAATALRKGEVVAMPTETVYGLGAGIFLPFALARIFDSKERPTFDPLIVHVAANCRSLNSLIELKLVHPTALNAKARATVTQLIEHFWPGPLTLVLPKAAEVPDLATAGLGTVGIRMPKHPVALKLIEMAGMPIAAPSANRFGSISPTSSSDVQKELGDRIPWIIEGGRCEVGVESTVVSVGKTGAVKLLRPGGISKEAIETLLGKKIAAQTTSTSSVLAAPGQTESHYAPKKPLTLLSGPIHRLKSIKAPKGKKIGFLLLTGNEVTSRVRLAKLLKCSPDSLIVQVLSPTGDYQEMAFHLFSSLRQLDHSKAQVLFAEPCLNRNGIGFAIADRLKRASATKRRGAKS